MQGYFTAGIGYTFTLPDNGKSPLFELEFWESYLLGALLTVCLAACVCVARRFREFSWILLIFMCVEIFGGMWLSERYTYWFNDVNLESMSVITYMGEREKQKILYLDEGGYPWFDLVQFHLPSYEMEIVDIEEMEGGLHNIYPEEGYLIVSQQSVYLEELRELTEPVEENGNLVLFAIEK